MKVSEIIESSENIKSLIMSLRQKKDLIRVQTPTGGFGDILGGLYYGLKVVIAKQALKQIEQLSAFGIDDFSSDIAFLESFLNNGGNDNG
jgi:hypothetical protein